MRAASEKADVDKTEEVKVANNGTAAADEPVANGETAEAKEEDAAKEETANGVQVE